MRMLSLAGFGAAGLVLVLTTLSSSATNANPPTRVFGVPAPRTNPTSRRPSKHRMTSAQPTPCGTSYGTTNGDDYFTGITTTTFNLDYAGGVISAVLGGTGNAACGQGSAIGAGGYLAFEIAMAGNNQTYGDDAFIGAGDVNSAEGNASFIGGGGGQYASEFGGECPCRPAYGNIASSTDSFIGAGDLNQISSGGNGSFIGGGGYTYASTRSGAAYPTTDGNQVSGVDSFIRAGD